MASIPSPIRKWVRRYITGEGSDEIASQSPVQSVNSQTGDVTISTGGGVIPSSQTVASYSDLPTTDRSQAEIWFVTGEDDIVASTQLSPVEWRSLSDFTAVVSTIPDSGLVHRYEADNLSLSAGDDVDPWPDQKGNENLTVTNTNNGSAPDYQTNVYNGEPAVDFTNTEYLSVDFASDIATPLQVFVVGELDVSASNGSVPYLFAGADDFDGGIGSYGEDWIVITNTDLTSDGNPSDSNPHIFDYKSTESNAEATVDGTTVATDSDAGDSLSGISLTARSDRSNTDNDAVGKIAAYLVYDTSVSGYSETDVRNYLTDKYKPF